MQFSSPKSWDLRSTLSSRGKVTSRAWVLGTVLDGVTPQEKKENPFFWRAKEGEKRFRRFRFRLQFEGKTVPTAPVSGSVRFLGHPVISGVALANQTKERPLHELFAGANWNRSSM